MVMTSNAAVCLHPRRLRLHVSHVCVSPGRQGSLVQRCALLRKRGHAADLWHAVLLRRRPRIAEFRARICAHVRAANGQYLSRTPSAVIKRATCECFFMSCVQIFRSIRHHLGRRNLANKTLVDPRFLIWFFLPAIISVVFGQPGSGHECTIRLDWAPIGTRVHHWYVSVNHFWSVKLTDIC